MMMRAPRRKVRIQMRPLKIKLSPNHKLQKILQRKRSRRRKPASMHAERSRSGISSMRMTIAPVVLDQIRHLRFSQEKVREVPRLMKT
jgi:hypothetical protein